MKRQKSKVAQRTERITVRMPHGLYHAVRVYQQNQEIPSSFTRCILDLLIKGFTHIEQTEHTEIAKQKEKA